ncbi:hypothetical protein D3C73_1413440 [compost metagenome]
MQHHRLAEPGGKTKQGIEQPDIRLHLKSFAALKRLSPAVIRQADLADGGHFSGMAFNERQQRRQIGFTRKRLLGMEAVGRLDQLRILPGQFLGATAGSQVH